MKRIHAHLPYLYTLGVEYPSLMSICKGSAAYHLFQLNILRLTGGASALFHNHYFWSFTGALLGSVVTGILLPITINLTTDHIIKKITTGSSSRNPWLSYLYMYYQTPVRLISEIGRRAESGKPLLAPARIPPEDTSFAHIMLSPASITEQTPEPSDIDTEVILARQSAKPVRLDTPIMIGIPAGPGLSAQARAALVQAASAHNTLLFCGTQAFTPQEIFGRCRFVSAITGYVNIGQDLLPGSAVVEIRVGVTSSDASSISGPRELAKLVSRLRREHGIPVAARIAAGNRLEADLAVLVEVECDLVILQGREAGNLVGPEVTAARLGMPLASAIRRARLFLEKHDLADRVDVIATGSVWTSSEVVKALALGASAVILDQPVLLALVHGQEKKAAPWQPQSALYLSEGSKRKKLDPGLAARSIENFLQATTQEIALAAACMGKRTLSDLTCADLITFDPYISQSTGIPLA